MYGTHPQLHVPASVLPRQVKFSMKISFQPIFMRSFLNAVFKYLVNDNEHINGSIQNSLLVDEMLVNNQFHKRSS